MWVCGERKKESKKRENWPHLVNSICTSKREMLREHRERKNTNRKKYKQEKGGRVFI